MRATLDDRARVQRMLESEVALARAEAAVSIIPARAATRSPRPAQAERYDIAALGEAAAAAGNLAIPLIKALDRRGRQDRSERRRATYTGERPARTSSTPRSCSNCARRSTSSIAELDRAVHGVHHAGRAPSPHPDGRAHLDAARRAHAVRAQACRLRGGARAFARTSATTATRGAGAAIRRRCRHARRARRARPRGRPAPGRFARSAAAGRALAHPSRPTGRGRERHSRSSPEPAARSPAMFRS